MSKWKVTADGVRTKVSGSYALASLVPDSVREVERVEPASVVKKKVRKRKVKSPRFGGFSG